MKNKKGFTLIEVLVVVVIIAVLASLILPRITAQVRKAQLAEAKQMCGAIARAEIRYATLHGELTTDLSKLDIMLSPSSAFPGGSYYAWNFTADFPGGVGIGLGFDPSKSPSCVPTDHKLGLDMAIVDGSPKVVKYWWREDLPGQTGGGFGYGSFEGQPNCWDNAV